MLTFFVSVEAKPGEPVHFDPPRQVEGYYQTFGVTAEDEAQLLWIIEDYIKGDLGSTFVGVSERWLPDLDGADSDVKDLIGDVQKVGIWYKSGRAWFGPDE
ncbi:MAG: hypothetical protein AB1898_32660 [Acidobacteriota bacterium]